MQDTVTSHPLIVQFQRILDHLDAFTQAVLNCDQVAVSAEEWATLEAAFAWRFRLAQQGTLQLVGEPGSRLLDLAVARLTVHTQWLLKHMLPPLRALADKDPQLLKKKCIKKLSSTLNLISDAMKSCQTPLHRIGKKLRKVGGQPLPYSSFEQSNVAQRIESLANLLRIWPSSDPGHMKLQAARVAFLLTEAGKETRRCLMYAMENIRKHYQLEMVIQKIEQAEHLCEKAGLSYKNSSGVEQKPRSQEEENSICAQVQLWPVQEYIALTLCALFMKEYLQMKLRSEDKRFTSPETCSTLATEYNAGYSISATLCALLEELPSIPAEMLAIIHQLRSPIDNENIPSCELTKITLLHSTLSPSRCLPISWLSWNSAIDTTEQETVENLITDFEMSQDSLPMHCPLLTSLVTNHVVPVGSEKNSVLTNLIAQTPLGNQHSATMKLKILLDLLWRNMSTLSSPHFSYKLNDAHCAHSTFLKLREILSSVLLDICQNKVLTVSPSESVAEKFDLYVNNLPESNKLPEVQKLSDALHRLERVANGLEKLLKGNEAESDTDILIATGETWLLVGCIQILLLSKFGHFDPVEKRTLQLLYTAEELKDTSQLLYVRELQARLIGLSLADQQPEDLHPFISASRERLNLLTDRKNELLKNLAYRPPGQPYFCQLTKDTSHYSNSLGSAEMVLGLHNRLQSMCQQLLESIQHPASTQTRVHQLTVAAEELLNEERMWRNSQRIFCSRIQKTYNLHFPDMVTPFLSAAQQLCHGTSLLASIIQKLLVRLKLKLVEDIVKLVQFPVAIPNQGVPLDIVNLCLDRVFCQQLQQLLCENENDLPVKQETYRLMKAGLEDLRNVVAAEGSIDSTTWPLLVKILARLAKLWMHENDERKQREIEKDQMFIQRGSTRCETLSDDQLEALGLQELFPTTLDEDFGDLQPEMTLDSAPIPLPKPVNLQELMSSEDMTFFCQLHLELMKMFTHTQWIAPPSSCVVRPNFVSPLLQRFQTFRQLLSHAAPGLDSSVDWHLAPSLALLASLALRIGNGDLSNGGISISYDSPVRGDPVIPRKPPDFYHDSNVDEARQCLPILNAIAKRTKELKQEWPDHPTLGQILVVMDRITSFPVTSPISRFLTGLELLLEKLRDWEENAHSGVSMASQVEHLTQQIITWRRLELQCWRDCLNTAAYRMATNASHWWFHIFSIVEGFDKVGTTGKLPSEKELIKSLQEFMERSKLGDFEARLDILFSFHCHTIHLPQSSRQDKLLNILWNIHQYYNQFSEAVNVRIHDLRAPIEKKLREFVKIARWNDINYWAVKKTVDKTRRTLLKHVREFEAVLKQPVSPVLTDPHPGPATLLSEAAGKLDRLQRSQSMKNREFPPVFYIASCTIPGQLIIQNETTQRAASLLCRAQTLFNKSRSLSKEALSKISYPTLIKTTDEVTVRIINTINHLKDLEIPADTPKQRRKTLAKSHLQLKKKALTDACRTLQQIGVSFRKGVTVWNDAEAADSLFDFSLPPLDLSVGVQHSTYQLCGILKCTSQGSRPDGELATVWDGSETYFYRSMARLSLLDTYLKNPHSDIGPALIERLRGFNSHLMIYAKMQKEKLTESFNSLRCLRCYISHIASLKKNDILLPRQSELHHCWRNLNNLLVNIILFSEQFLVFVGACPSESISSFTMEISGQSAVDEMSRAVYADVCWQTVTKNVKNVLVGASKLKAVLNKSWISFPESPIDIKETVEKSDMELPRGTMNLITPSQYELIIEGYEKVAGFSKELKSVRSICESSEGSDSIFNPMTESLRTLETLIHREVGLFKEMQTSDNSLKGVKRSGIEIENKELEICVNVPDKTSELTMKVADSVASNQQCNIQISLSNKHLTEHEKKEVVNEFCTEAENLLEATLIAIQKIYKKYKAKEEETQVQIVEDSANLNETEDDQIGVLQDNHLKEKVLENLFSDLSDLQIPKINKMLSKLIQRLAALLDLEDWEKEATECKGALLTCIPCIDQLSLLYQFLVTQQAAAYRVTCKMMSVTLSVSIELALKGFCIPPELMPEDGEEGDPKGGLGLGEGEGEKDVSDRIESEDQLEDAKRPGEEKKDEEKECKEEEQGIDTSQDFGGKIQDVDKDEDESGDSEEEDDADKEMGETGEGADKLDQEVWGSDSEGEGENEEEEKKDELGQGETTGNSELSAKDDKRKGNESDEEEEEEEGDEGEDKKEKQKDINEFDEPEIDEDHVDPYHGKQPPLPEPEPLDLPDDLQLDDEDGKEGAEDEENPFDIDAMKERKIPEDEEKKEEETAGPEEEEEVKEDTKVDSSDEEDEGEGGKDKNDVQDSENHEKEEDESGEGNDEGKKDDKKDNEEKAEELKKEEKASPSDDLPSEAPAQAADMEAESFEGSKDMVAENKNEQKDDGKQDADDLGEEGGDEEQGVGQAQAEEQKSGHRGHMSAPRDKLPSNAPPPDVEERRDKRQRPGESDSSRSLGNVSEPIKKRLKTIDIKQSNEDDNDNAKEGEEESKEEQGAEEGKKGEMYQHIKDPKESYDTQTLDAATQEQAEKQPVPNTEEEPSEEPTPEDDIGIQEDDIMVDEDIKKQNPELLPSGKKDKDNKKPKQSENEEDVEMTMDIEGDVVPTQTPSRGAETTFHTQYNFGDDGLPHMKEIDMQNIRQELENQLSTWTQPPADSEAAQAWQNFVAVTAGLSRELSEQLRLVLEPTQAARLRGDYRTGRRINMRKVIPYIASQFRKDKIWLRRTKPSKREYQIVLAIDDSSSMADNHTKELAFESLALVSRALSLLEAGELAVVSFGDTPRILHQLGDTFTEHSGGRLLQEFSFSQKHTKVGQLVDFCSLLLRDCRQRVSSASECAQLLMIVSDGRGVFSEGDEKVRLAIRHARQNRIFMVFVILDNPDSKNSILDIRAPVFQGGKLLGIKSYLDGFPFPFYLILRDINCLPAVLSDALRQWFELVANTDA